MKIQREIGILYDAMSYLKAHFAEETLQNSDDGILDEIACDLGDFTIPSIIAPFFKGREGLNAPLLEYLRIHGDNCTGVKALSSLLSEEEEREKLRLMTTYTLFYPHISADEHGIHSDRAEPSHGDCSMKMAMRLDQTDYPSDFKYQALLCLTYFRHAVGELCRTLTRVADALERAGEKVQSEINAVFSDMRQGKFGKLYVTSSGLDFGIFNEITVSFSLLHPELFLPVCREKNLMLLVGKDHADALVRDFDEESIDLSSFLDDMGNELRRMILETLSEQAELTASDISRLTGIPVTTALRHMEALCDHYLIRVSHRKGLQIFYTVNREYLKKARMKTNKYLLALGGE